MIVDYKCFTGILSIGLTPDIEGAASLTQIAERERIDSYIETYEAEYLRKVLGESVYNEFVKYLDSQQDEDTEFEALYSILMEKYSPIACYVYFKLLLVGNYHITSVGAVSASGEDTVSPRRRQIAVWNDMVSINRRIYDILKGRKGYNPEPTMLETINELCI